MVRWCSLSSVLLILACVAHHATTAQDEPHDGGQSLYAQGLQLSQSGDLAGALPIFTAAAGEGHIASQVELGLLLAQGAGGAKQDLPAAQALFEAAAARGSGMAKYNLYRLLKGQNAQGAKLAMDWLAKAANDGVAAAQNALGLAYSKGADVPQDLGKVCMASAHANANANTCTTATITTTTAAGRQSHQLPALRRPKPTFPTDPANRP